MVYIHRKMKTSRRVKRTKTKNTRKRKRNRTFRKSRRVNRGGTGKDARKEDAIEDKWQEDTRTEKEKSEQDAIANKKDKKNELKRVANISSGLYLEPSGEGVAVDQEELLETAEKQQLLMDELDAERLGEKQPGQKRRRLEKGPIWIDSDDEEEEKRNSFGGKKKRSVKKK
jgi:hypothetical protein